MCLAFDILNVEGKLRMSVCDMSGLRVVFWTKKGKVAGVCLELPNDSVMLSLQ
jgi:hypothetical protein